MNNNYFAVTKNEKRNLNRYLRRLDNPKKEQKIGYRVKKRKEVNEIIHNILRGRSGERYTEEELKGQIRILLNEIGKLKGGL